ncbi:MAG: hypothetical protein DRP35_02845 [Candidatus Zixiibacteriota bacterium]|nr:MAG: hypothetical protein DRP35_02845 [candidate division Zixibacteria bacterium]
MSYDVPGDLLIFLALVFNLISGVAFFMTARGNSSYENLARKAYNYFTGCAILMFAYLYYLFFSYNFAIKYVYEYSDRSLSFFFTLAAFWAGQEGTYVLWVTLSALFGYIILKYGDQYRNYAMVAYATVNAFFLTLMTSLSPFAMLGGVPPDGLGLNPLLHDPWMVVHPPVIFIGYAMAAIPFSLAISALIINDYSSWVKKAFPWTAITALMLAGGNILGAYWAYKTLGWGGYWAWDPVENSSFIPWFIALALIHGMIIERRSGALKRTNILMAAFGFILVIYGTFITRSGVLSDFSVHSFVDLGINIYLIGFLAFYIFITLILFLMRTAKIESKPLNYNFYGKEFSLFAGMNLLFLFGIVVLFWTSLPILTTYFTNNPRAADVATYNSFALPFAILYALFLTAAPLLNYKGFVPKNWKRKLIISSISSAVVGFGLFYFVLGTAISFAVVFTLVITGLVMYLMKSDLLGQLKWSLGAFVLTILICYVLDVTDYSYILYLASASLFIVSNLISMFSYLPSRWKLSGGQLTHFGFGLMLLGILGSSAYSTDERLVIPRGETKEAYDLKISYQGMENEITVPMNKLLLTYDEGDGEQDAHPQLYYSERLNGIMKKPFVLKRWDEDLYFSPEQVQELSSSRGIKLREGESYKYQDYNFTFEGFTMGDHSEQQNSMSVVAKLKVEHNGSTEFLEPIKVYETDQNGKQNQIDFPANFGDDNNYSVEIADIEASQGAVIFTFPGLMEIGPPDRLIMTITKKPIINLVWAGTILILLGTLVMYFRRRSEALV